MKIKCPECYSTLDIPDSYIGQQVKCQKCGHSFGLNGRAVFETLQVNDSNYFLPVISFLIPLAGIIIGAIFVSKPDKADKNTGKNCLIWAVIGIFADAILYGIFLA